MKKTSKTSKVDKLRRQQITVDFSRQQHHLSLRKKQKTTKKKNLNSVAKYVGNYKMRWELQGIDSDSSCRGRKMLKKMKEIDKKQEKDNKTAKKQNDFKYDIMCSQNVNN